MGLVEKWNNFAKKSIYINHKWEIGCGRLVFSLILIGSQWLHLFIITDNPLVITGIITTFLAGLKKQNNNKKGD